MAVAALVALPLGCSRGPATIPVAIDGGAAGVVLTDRVAVAARPGDTVVLRHAATARGPDDESPVHHMLVAAPADALPPLFVGNAGGSSPNSGVWGECHGGAPAEAAQGCPVPAIEGPAAWDGVAYWSTGAFLPSEERDVALADDIAPGTYTLICAIHPDLQVAITVGKERDTAVEVPADAQARTAAAQDVLSDAAAAELAGTSADFSAGLEQDAAFIHAFAPATVRIPVGGQVTWTAAARTPVDVVFDPEGGEISLAHTDAADGTPSGDGVVDGSGLVRSGFLSADPGAGAVGASFTATFPVAGTYSYASRFSVDLAGTVVVG